MSSSPTPEERYAALVEALRDTPGVTAPARAVKPGKKFGDTGLKTGGKIFAMLSQGRLVVKLPRHRIDALVAAGSRERFDPGHGRVMKEWLSLDPAAEEEWLPLARKHSSSSLRVPSGIDVRRTLKRMSSVV